MQFNKSHIITWALLLISLAVTAQQVKLSGRVTKDGCDEPLIGIEVSLNKALMNTTTDSNGYFLLADIEAGVYKLMLYKDGFMSKVQQLEIKSDTYIDLTMEGFDKELEMVEVNDKSMSFSKDYLRQVEGTSIYAGKKTELVKMSKVQGNLAANTSRQIYAKVAGLNIWESDGSGIQLDIGGRGLNPSRSSNFNIRQNGYDISADALGYPESYYTPPSQAIDEIEIVRGAASLQYGTQFGGMINYRLNQGDAKKAISVNTQQTAGSFGFFSSFNSIGGTKGKFSYYAFYQYKRGDGWRPNSEFQYHTGHLHLGYQVLPSLKLSAEYTIMNYVAHQPGGLTDALFKRDPSISIRQRNWFQVRWNLMNLNLDWKIGSRTKLNSRFFGLVAQRQALGFLGSISRTDPLQERDLIQGKFRNFGNETRVIHRYYIGGKISNFLIGFRVYNGSTENKQGLASDGYEADFNFNNPNDLETSAHQLPSQNVALFAENVFTLHKKLSITPGIRYEYIQTKADGYYRNRSTDLAGNIIYDEVIADDRSSARNLVLAGIGLSYKPLARTEVYGNFSQNYRAITFNDMRISNPNFRIDPNLKDERGYTIDLGLRGAYKSWLSYDVNGFFLKYDNRIGEVLLQDTVLYNLYRMRTNISNSRTFGIESYIEFDFIQLISDGKSAHNLSIYTNFTWQNARYVSSDQPAFDGNKVELVPEFIVRTGLQYKWKELRLAYQFSYTAEQFTDATNAPFTPSAINGIIPAYYVMDFSASYRYKQWSLSTGINNITNNAYFTRRATGYPGPGIIPADPINFYVTLGFKI